MGTTRRMANILRASLVTPPFQTELYISKMQTCCLDNRSDQELLQELQTVHTPHDHVTYVTCMVHVYLLFLDPKQPSLELPFNEVEVSCWTRTCKEGGVLLCPSDQVGNNLVDPAKGKVF